MNTITVQVVREGLNEVPDQEITVEVDVVREHYRQEGIGSWQEWAVRGIRAVCGTVLTEDESDEAAGLAVALA